MKRFPKESLKTLVTIVVTAIIVSSTTVFAYSLMAENTGFTPKDSSWGVTNVDAALNDMHTFAALKGHGATNYSTTEKVVGTWIDGKPLYQKTIYRNKVTATEGIVIDSTLNRSNVTVYSFESSAIGAANNRVSLGDFWIRSGNYYQPVLWQHANGVAVATDRELTDIYITVKYTKTTD